MADTIFYITAGLPVAKDSGQSPSSGVNTVYMSAGLSPDVEADPGGFGGVSNVIGGGIAA